MNSMNEPPMSQKPGSSGWPDKAIPQHWVEALFSKMSAYYGSRFADMWRGTNTVEVQKAWAKELGKLSKEQLKVGTENLTAFVRPPSLPEFVEHCKKMRLEAATFAAPQLENLTRADQKVIDSNLHRLQGIVGGVELKSANKRWAVDMLERGCGKNGAPLTVEVIQSCKDVIEGKKF